MEYGRWKSSWRRCSRHVAYCGLLFLVLCQASGCGDNASPPAPTPPPVAANHSPVASAAVIPDQALPSGRNAATVAVTDMDPGWATATQSIAVTVGQGNTHGGPDLVVESPGVSSPTVDPEAEFMFSATVRNVGDGDAAATTLRYYRSTGATITASDTEIGTDAVAGGRVRRHEQLPFVGRRGHGSHGTGAASLTGSDGPVHINCHSHRWRCPRVVFSTERYSRKRRHWVVRVHDTALLPVRRTRQSRHPTRRWARMRWCCLPLLGTAASR